MLIIIAKKINQITKINVKKCVIENFFIQFIKKSTY